VGVATFDPARLDGPSSPGGSAEKRFELLQPFKKKGYISTWLESRNWRLDPASVSNEIQNHAVILQYARDFQEKHGAKTL